MTKALNINSYYSYSLNCSVFSITSNVICYNLFRMTSNKKILVLGASGMLGHVVATYFREQGYDVDTVVNLGSFDDKSYQINLMNKNDFELFLNERKSKYDYILNAVGILVQLSDDRKDLASYINAYLPHQLEYFFKDTPTKIIHYSTDCVFSGKNGPYTEEAFQDGELFYDKSKALGEIVNKKDLTFRQSIIGPDLNEKGVGLFNWFMSQKSEANGFSGAIWNGITTIELAKATHKAIEQNLTGLYQLTPPDNINKYELLKLFNSVFNRKIIIHEDTKSMNINKTLVNTRSDFQYTVSDYPVMVDEMRDWIAKHPALYTHYGLLK
jgi:dTDP-4-dehydrorhamnose reductase